MFERGPSLLPVDVREPLHELVDGHSAHVDPPGDNVGDQASAILRKVCDTPLCNGYRCAVSLSCIFDTVYQPVLFIPLWQGQAIVADYRHVKSRTIPCAQ